MGRKKLLKDKLQMIGGAVPPPVKAIIVRAAEREKRTVSAIVRRVIEESPSIKAEMRQPAKVRARS
jgi:hypothetical protein